MLKKYWKKGGKQKSIVVVGSLVLLLALFLLRDDYQPALLFVRKYIFIILLSFLFLWMMIRMFRNASSTGKRLLYLLFIVLFFGAGWFLGWKLSLYDYMVKYNVYINLDRVELDELPLTRNERIQPFNNIVTMAYESIGETKEVSLPHLVRVDGNNQWTMAVQPAKEYDIQRIRENTEELFSVSSTSPFPKFSGESRIPTTFSIGESLAWSRNTYNAVVQRMNPWQLVNNEPGDAMYMKNDEGNWVQVVSLIKWKGFFFPYPTFGGVMIVESGAHDFNDYIERLFIGKGKYISNKELPSHEFLTRQNIISEKVTRLQAESLQFLGGFTDPLPWNKKTAVKIPDQDDDENWQPFVTDFSFDGMNEDAYNGLYHWFGLEPIGEERTSLSYSVVVPADGTDKLYYYDHASKKEGLAGVSAMPLKVIESKKEYDWDVNKPVEFRPYIKEIGGRKRMFVLSTVASKREDSKKFDGAATPDLVLIDVAYRDVIWVDAKKPDTWDETVYNQLIDVWSDSEDIPTLPKQDNLIEEVPDSIVLDDVIEEVIDSVLLEDVIEAVIDSVLLEE